ncbi:MAG: biotin transporter BioY [Anaerolineaceae bacterium]
MENTLAFTLIHRLHLNRSRLADLGMVLTGSLVVALLAQVRIPLLFTPVPLTGQTLGVLLVAAALGSRRGAAALALYLVEGLAGLPVFAGGSLGLARLMGPTGGYLIGFIAAAYLVGSLAEKGWDRRWDRVALMFVLGEVVIYLFGAGFLATVTGIPQAWAAGVAPFLLGDVLKAAAAAALLPAAWKWLDREPRQG